MKLYPLALSFLMVVMASAAEPTNEALQARIAARDAALAALRAGNTARADTLLEQAAQGTPNSAVWRLDYASYLMSAAIDLKDHDQYAASTEYFHRAAAQYEAALTAEGAPTDGAAKAEIYNQLGFIARVADGNQETANGYFKQALTEDATNERAKAALQRTKEGRKKLEEISRKQ